MDVNDWEPEWLTDKGGFKPLDSLSCMSADILVIVADLFIFSSGLGFKAQGL